MHIIELVPPKEPSNLPEYYERVSNVINATKRVSIASKPSGQSISGFDKSINLIRFLQEKQLDLNIVLHVTCRDINKQNIHDRLGILRELNVRDILIVTGDGYEKSSHDDVSFRDSKHLLVEILKDYKDWFSGVAVAGYPGGNGRSSFNNDSECERLTEAIELGSNIIYTQCSFEPETFNEFKMKLNERHAHVQIIPSIALFKSAQDLDRIIRSTRVGNSTVAELIRHLQTLDEKQSESYCLDYLSALCENLASRDIDICAFNHYEMAETLVERIVFN